MHQTPEDSVDFLTFLFQKRNRSPSLSLCPSMFRPLSPGEVSSILSVMLTCGRHTEVKHNVCFQADTALLRPLRRSRPRARLREHAPPPPLPARPSSPAPSRPPLGLDLRNSPLISSKSKLQSAGFLSSFHVCNQWCKKSKMDKTNKNTVEGYFSRFLSCPFCPLQDSLLKLDEGLSVLFPIALFSLPNYDCSFCCAANPSHWPTPSQRRYGEAWPTTRPRPRPSVASGSPSLASSLTKEAPPPSTFMLDVRSKTKIMKKGGEKKQLHL